MRLVSSFASFLVSQCPKLKAILGILALAATCRPIHAQMPDDIVKSDQYDNVAAGSYALYQNDNTDQPGYYNIAIGSLALNVNQSGYANVAIGEYTLSSNLSGNSNVAVGYGALLNSVGSDNVAIGADSLFSNTIGADNVGLGYQTLLSNSTGIDNIAIGSSALLANSAGSYNIASGKHALQTNTIGNNNVATGTSAMYSNQNGGENVATGNYALYSNTVGNNNIGAGYFALVTNTTGSNNVAMGAYALYVTNGGANNSAIGFETLYNNTIGNSNIALGYKAGYNLTTGSNDIYVGSAGGAASESDAIRIGTKGLQKATYIVGIDNTSLISGSLPVYVNPAGRLSVGTSSERYKVDIAPMTTASNKLKQLRPVSFHLKNDPQGTLQYGLIAEEVAKVYPELVVRDEDGEIQGVRYDELAPMLLNEVQQQKSELQVMQEQLAEMKKQNKLMQTAMAKLLAVDERVAMR